MSATILIGTASWSDPEFVRDWYPAEVRPADRLAYYAQRFETVELNSSFYAMPTPRLAESWARTTPPAFTFDAKLHQLLSRHVCELRLLPQKLQRVAKISSRNRVVLTPELERAAVEEFLGGLEPLVRAGKMGVLLLQLAPTFSPVRHRLDELDALLAQLSPRRVAVELRHRSWVEGDTLDQTSRHFVERGVSLVSVDAPASDHRNVMPALDVVTNPGAAYLRLHGRDARAYLTGKTVAERFDYDYSDAELAEVKKRVLALGQQALVVHVIFNNNRSDYAPQAALRFRRLLGQAVPADAARPAQGTLNL